MKHGSSKQDEHNKIIETKTLRCRKILKSDGCLDLLIHAFNELS